MRKEMIKKLVRQCRPPRPPGPLYWEDRETGILYRVPTAAEWEEADQAFRLIAKPAGETDEAELKRWTAWEAKFCRRRGFKINRDQAGPLTHIPLTIQGHPSIKGLWEVPGEFSAALRLFGEDPEFYRGQAQ